MANNYTVTSYRITDKEWGVPSLGPLGKLLFKGVGGDESWFDETKGIGVMDQGFSMTAGGTRDLIKGAFGVSDAESLVEKLGVVDTWADVLYGTEAHDCVGIDVMYYLAKDEPGSTLSSVFWEEGWWCSKNRHDNFGGQGMYIGEHVAAYSGSSGGAQVGMPMDALIGKDDIAGAAKVLLDKLVAPILDTLDFAVRDRMTVALVDLLKTEK